MCIAIHMSIVSAPHSLVINILVSFLAFVFLVLVLLYAIYELYRQTSLAWRDQHSAASFCFSAFLGSFLFGLVSLAFTSIEPQAIGFSGSGIVLSILALIGLLFFSIRRPLEVTARKVPPPAVPTPVTLPVSGSDAFEESQVGGRLPADNNVTTPPKMPMPPLLHDPLDYIPQLHSSRLFSVAKPNARAFENEDACVISLDETRFALSDGAGGSELPRSWAILLGQQWLKAPLYNDHGIVDVYTLSQWLEEPRLLWAQWVEQIWWPRVNERNSSTDTPPVSRRRIGEIVSKGASATFLGLIVDHSRNQWLATAIGDTCLFYIHGGSAASSPRIKPIMPITESTRFNQTPPLLNTCRDNSGEHLASTIQSLRGAPIQSLQGSYNRGDYLFMATDALARWLLFQKEQNRSEWQELLTMQEPERFVHFVDTLRKHETIEEDDTTLVVIPLF